MNSKGDAAVAAVDFAGGVHWRQPHDLIARLPRWEASGGVGSRTFDGHCSSSLVIARCAAPRLGEPGGFGFWAAYDERAWNG